MNAMSDFAKRATLSRDQLVHLRDRLMEEVDTYKISIRDYSPEKMAEIGTPYLAVLASRVADIDAELASRT